MRPTIIILAIGSLLFLCITLCKVGRAELPQRAYDKLIKEAPEKLQIEIEKVEIALTQRLVSRVDCLAKVTKVIGSKSGIKVGDSIQIYYSHTPARFREPGPSQAPILKKGWKGTAYLKKSAGKNARLKKFSLAAHGQSFSEDTKK